MTGLNLNYALGRKLNRVELYFCDADKDKNKRRFDKLFADKDEIERRFGGSLGWERLDDKRAGQGRIVVGLDEPNTSRE